MQKEFELLKNILNSKTCPHAFIFYGPEDVGKYEIAIKVAKYLNCKNKKDNNFCDKCDQCRMINNLIHPDLYIVEKLQNKKEIVESQIGDTKTEGSLIFNLTNSKLASDYKICIIKDIHFLNKFAANNLLKILEEPPENTIIILTTSNLNEVLETIKSRCSIINFNLLDKKEVFELLGKDDELLYILSSNKYNKTIELKDTEFINSVVNDINEFLYIIKGNSADKILYINKILGDKTKLKYYVYIWETAINLILNKDNPVINEKFDIPSINLHGIEKSIKKLYNINDAEKGNYILKIYLNEFILNL